MVGFRKKTGGMYVFTPTITAEHSDWYRGTADALYQNLDFLKKSHEPYVVIAAGDGIYKLDYNKVLEYHIEKKADITVVCKDMPGDVDVTRFGMVKTNADGRIVEFEEKPMVADSHTISCGIYVVRRRQLIELIERCANEADMTSYRTFWCATKVSSGLCVQVKYILEQHRFCRCLLPDKYGLLKTGSAQLLLQRVSGYLLQGG